MVYRGNWKLQNDNNGDIYHAPVTHRSVAEMNRVRYGAGKTLDHFKNDQSPMLAKYFGHGHKLLDQRPAIESPWERARPVPGREVLGESLGGRLGDAEAKRYLDLTGRSGINLVLYPNLLLLGHGAFAVYEPLEVARTNVRYYTVLPNDAPPEMNRLRVRFSEDFNNVGARDDNEIFERIQNALENVPEMEWLDFSKGLGSGREHTGSDGAITGNISDETGIRGSYFWWKTLMNRDFRPSVLGVEPPGRE
jgi:phenylpropionate dioxygenase-like ring-hydroxylating dioxygenase large terminal subunit